MNNMNKNTTNIFNNNQMVYNLNYNYNQMNRQMYNPFQYMNTMNTMN